MDALRHASIMLAELRTSSLQPKQYYDLCNLYPSLLCKPFMVLDMSIFDQLGFLSQYLYEAHLANRHHLSELYEIVQYANQIVPRLYFMITVGAVYMRVAKEAALASSESNEEKPLPDQPAEKSPTSEFSTPNQLALPAGTDSISLVN